MRLLIFVLFAIMIPASNASSKDALMGTADKIVDGDTLWVCDQSVCEKIRLCGIDAPEKRQAGATAATQALKKLVSGKTIKCIFVGGGSICDDRSYLKNGDRFVAQCFVDNIDIAAELVRQSHACDWPKYSGGLYSKILGACSRK